MTASPRSQLVIFIAIPLAVGGISGFITAHEIGSWFVGLHKPSFNPPNWIFGPVWTVLYIIMGISCLQIWRTAVSKQRQRALWIYALQLALNFWWSIIFFSFHLLGLALVDISILWILIVAMIVYFRRLQPTAGYLQIPYLAWVTFATALNAGFFLLN